MVLDLIGTWLGLELGVLGTKGLGTGLDNYQPSLIDLDTQGDTQKDIQDDIENYIPNRGFITLKILSTLTLCHFLAIYFENKAYLI